MRSRILAALTGLGTVLAMLFLAPSAAHADTQICDKYGSTAIAGGKYIVQNNNWGDDTTQCINVTGSGFTLQ
ncbi:MAG TPA: hypothetical protein VL738_19250 [Dactylosporangium sp.]|jgi:hypothetical protein|nr:hypothetical protein [Dactylosporangium sp.]